jgi:hypothetical protein
MIVTIVTIVTTSEAINFFRAKIEQCILKNMQKPKGKRNFTIHCTDGVVRVHLPYLLNVSEFYSGIMSTEFKGEGVMKSHTLPYRERSMEFIFDTLFYVTDRSVAKYTDLQYANINEVCNAVEFLLFTRDAIDKILLTIFSIFKTRIDDTPNRAQVVLNILTKFPYIIENSEVSTMFITVLFNTSIVYGMVPILLKTPHAHCLVPILSRCYADHLYSLYKAHPDIIFIAYPCSLDMCIKIIRNVQTFAEVRHIYNCVIDQLKKLDDVYGFNRRDMCALLYRKCSEIHTDKPEILTMMCILDLLAK